MTLSLRYDIAREAARHQLALDDETGEALARYVELLGRWGARIRLTGESSPAVVIERHLADVFAAAAALGPQVAAAAPRSIPAIDVGSGAGLPGVVLARVLAALEMHSVESRQRKASFQRSAAHELGVEVSVHAARLESLAGLDGRFALVMSRATFAPATWLERAQPLCAAAARVLVFCAAREDLPDAPAGYAEHEVHAYSLADGTPRVIGIYQK
ncbi:MAG: class I SAM-dependent methyltransferase [Myxococcales bacterium]|nr:class I SAM-dependent methyltransferase [Myxococcales bacterium]